MGHFRAIAETGAVATVLTISNFAPALAQPASASTSESLSSIGAYLVSIRVLRAPPSGANDSSMEHSTSANIAKFAFPELEADAYANGGVGVDTVSGATYTSRAFSSSLQGAIAKLASSAPGASAVGPVVAVAPCAACLRFGVVQVRATDAVATVGIAVDSSFAGGYWIVSANGTVTPKGGAPTLGEPSGISRSDPILAVAGSSNGAGYLLVDRAGQVFNYGDVPSESGPGPPAGSDVVGVALTSDGDGYWLVTSGGAVYPFGDASAFPGPEVSPSGDVIGIAASAGDQGYWLATSSGDVDAYGAAANVGTLPIGYRAFPIVAIASSANGAGYVLASTRGTVFEFGYSFPFISNGASDGITSVVFNAWRPVSGIALIGNGTVADAGCEFVATSGRTFLGE